MAETALRVEEVRTLERFRELASPWNDLCDRAVECCPTVRHAFLVGWIEAFGAELQLRILLIWDADRLVSGVPFAYRSEALFGQQRRVLGVVANTWIDRSPLLIASVDPAILRALCAHLRAAQDEFDLIAFGPLDATSAVARLLRTTARLDGWYCGAESILQSPFLELPATWDDLLGRLSPTFRATLRRKLRNAEKTPGVSMRIVDDASCWDAVSAVSPATWQAREGTAMTSRPELSAFYEGVVRDAAARGSLRCAVLFVDEVPVAFDLNILERGVLFSFKMGFRSEQAALSAGLVLKAFLLRAAMSRDAATIRSYDFMGTAEEYKLHWTPEVRPYHRQFLFPPGVAGAVTHWVYFVARPWMRTRTPRLWAAVKRVRSGA